MNKSIFFFLFCFLILLAQLQAQQNTQTDWQALCAKSHNPKGKSLAHYVKQHQHKTIIILIQNQRSCTHCFNELKTDSNALYLLLITYQTGSNTRRLIYRKERKAYADIYFLESGEPNPFSDPLRAILQNREATPASIQCHQGTIQFKNFAQLFGEGG